MARIRSATVLMSVVVAVGAAGCSDDDSSSSATAVGPTTQTEVATDSTSPTTQAADSAAPTTSATLPATAAPASTEVAPTTAATTTTTTTATTATTTTTTPEPVAFDALEIAVYPVPEGSRPHDVAPAADGGVWYTAQRAEALGHLDPLTGETRHIPLGDGSAPHGVIVGTDGVAWVTDGGLNAIVSVDPAGDVVTVFPLPDDAPDANLNTAAFGDDGRLWFTGQSGYHGVLDPATGVVETYESPRGSGPYGITATPEGQIFYASLAGSYVGAVQPDGSVIVLDPPTPEQGARRVWSDSEGAIWVSEWSSGQLSRFTPSTGAWNVWPLPGDDPAAYAVYVDDADQVWVSDFGGNAIHRFLPATESFETFPLPARPSEVRQILGRGDEVWGAQSADDSLVVIRPAS